MSGSISGKLTQPPSGQGAVGRSRSEQLIGKREHAIPALSLGCGLRRQELAQLTMEDIVERESRAVIVDLVGKRRRLRTVAVPPWVKQSVVQWTTAAGITGGPLLRLVSKSGKVGKTALGAWSVWSVVERCASEIGIKDFGPHDLRRTCAKLCQETRRRP
jgi:integrase/recombinase XerD